MLDAVVENLVIESDNLMPNVFEVANDNYFRWGRKKIANKNHNAVMLSVSGIQMDLRDVSYYVKKKQGFPSITDTGVADIFLGGTGFSFKIKMSTAEAKDKQNFFKVDSVNVDVKNFNIKLVKSKHKLLFGLAKPLMLKVMRPALQKVLEKVIKDKFTELDAMAYQVKVEADRAQQEVIENPDQAQNIYSRYVSAFQKKMMEGKQKTQAVASKTKVNMAMTRHDSIFPNIQLPGGISSKATEYKDLATKNPDTWESPIFKLGTASTSSDIASAPEVTRKDHAVTEGGVRGPQNIGNSGSATQQLNDPAAQTQGMSNGATTNGALTKETNGLSKPNGVNGHTGTTLGASNPVLTGSS